MKRLSELLNSPGKSLEKIGKPHRKALLISMMMLFFLLMPLLWYASFWYGDVLIKDIKEHGTIHATIYGNALTTVINKRFSLLEGLFAFTMANPSDQGLKKNFNIFTSGLYSSTKGIRNFALAPGGVQRYVYPFRGNEATLGHDLINDSRPAVRADVLRAINTRKTAISGPYELRQGGLGLIARKALYINDTFWGLVTMAIDIPPIFEEAMFSSQLSNIEIALRDSSGNIFFGTRNVFENEPAKFRIELQEGSWELGGIPLGGWQKATANKLNEFRVAGLIVSILIAIIMYLLISRYSLLAEKNKYLRQSHQNLEQEVTERKRAEEALRESENKYRELSIVDGLTQLYNSRHFYHQLKIEIERSDRYGLPLSLLLLDLDDFKRFNDAYGHIEGDRVLLRLSQVVKRRLRQVDSAYRYGGEEFTIILPMTTVEAGAVTAERIRTEFKKETFSPSQGKETHATVSIGLAQHKPQEEMKAFVHRVDQLMYQGKKNGKDRVCCES